jgi:hypothetical protein
LDLLGTKSFKNKETYHRSLLEFAHRLKDTFEIFVEYPRPALCARATAKDLLDVQLAILSGCAQTTSADRTHRPYQVTIRTFVRPYSQKS